jgi:hypothetical protein
MQSIIKLAISKQTFIKLEIINLAIINDASNHLQPIIKLAGNQQKRNYNASNHH